MVCKVVLVLFSVVLLVVVDAGELNPCRGSYHTTVGGWTQQTPILHLTETGAVRNFAGCHGALPRQCYLGDCIDTGCWLALPRTRGVDEDVYHVQAPYLTSCFHGLGACVRGTCVERKDANKYTGSELALWYFRGTTTLTYSSYQTCAENDQCLEAWNANCSPVDAKPAHLGEEIMTYDCAPLEKHGDNDRPMFDIEHFVSDGMICGEGQGECYGCRCYTSDFPPYCPRDEYDVFCDGSDNCRLELVRTGESRFPGCSGQPPMNAKLFW